MFSVQAVDAVLEQCPDRASMYVEGKFKYTKYKPGNQGRYKVKIVARRPPPLGPRAAKVSEEDKSKLLEKFLHALSSVGQSAAPSVDDDLSYEGYLEVVKELRVERKKLVPSDEVLAGIFKEVRDWTYIYFVLDDPTHPHNIIFPLTGGHRWWWVN
jgi:hypothetical protein